MPREATSRLLGSIDTHSFSSGLLVVQSASETPSRSSMAAASAASAGSSLGDADDEAPLVMIATDGPDDVLDGCASSPPPQAIVAAPAKARAKTMFRTDVSSNAERPPVHPLPKSTRERLANPPRQIPSEGGQAFAKLRDSAHEGVVAQNDRSGASIFQRIEDEAGGDFWVEESGLLGHALARVRDVEDPGDGDRLHEQGISSAAAAYVPDCLGGVFGEPERAVVRHLRFFKAEDLLRMTWFAIA